jgi:hypothetical protein
LKIRGSWSTLLLFTPLGANFDPRGEIVPQGWILFCWGWSYPLWVKFFVRPSILLNSRVFSLMGVNEGVNIRPRGQISPLGPGARSEVKNGPLG